MRSVVARTFLEACLTCRGSPYVPGSFLESNDAGSQSAEETHACRRPEPSRGALCAPRIPVT